MYGFWKKEEETDRMMCARVFMRQRAKKGFLCDMIQI